MNKVYKLVNSVTVLGGLVGSYMVYKAFSSNKRGFEEASTMFKPAVQPPPIPNPPPKIPPELTVISIILALNVISITLAIFLAIDITKQKTQTGTFNEGFLQ